jgi:hypothetical protein
MCANRTRLEPLGRTLAQSPIVVLVDAKSSYHSIQHLVDAARAAPGKLNFGTGGGGATLTALSAIMLRRAVGFDAAAIYFPGSGPANIALLGGTIDFSFDTVSGAIGLITGNSLRPGHLVSGWLVPVGRIDAVKLSQQGRPRQFTVPIGLIRPRLDLVEGFFQDVIGWVDQLGIAG